MDLKISSAKYGPFCSGLNILHGNGAITAPRLITNLSNTCSLLYTKIITLSDHDLLLIGPLGPIFFDFSSKYNYFWYINIFLKMSVKFPPYCTRFLRLIPMTLHTTTDGQSIPYFKIICFGIVKTAQNSSYNCILELSLRDSQCYYISGI